MKELMLGLVTPVCLGQAGYEFIGGVAVGPGATGAGYKYYAYRQEQQLEEDYKAERISRAEYEAQKITLRQDRSSTTNTFQGVVARVFVIC